MTSETNPFLIRPMSTSLVLPTNSVRRIISHCDGDSKLHPLRDTVRIIANTGMCPAQLANLSIFDIDSEGRQLFICPTSAHGTIRRVPIQQKTHATLLALHVWRDKSHFVLGSQADARIQEAASQFSTLALPLTGRRASLYFLHLSFEHRLMSTRIPIAVGDHLLGFHRLGWTLRNLHVNPEREAELVRGTIKHFLEEL